MSNQYSTRLNKCIAKLTPAPVPRPIFHFFLLFLSSIPSSSLPFMGVLSRCSEQIFHQIFLVFAVLGVLSRRRLAQNQPSPSAAVAA